ncbi:hypothetical protein BA190_08080 [Labrys sp. WJW]|uniref:hypothetical protein n=1 Tax=Labrys sp. WJW TaxID=1737983 RepID=UPI00083685AF|nr:hypothetical protein [Labrys sp. WJW]OCC05381.1 hypothetical protein BA190_08080 [Labrys sp. WJW]
MSARFTEISQMINQLIAAIFLASALFAIKPMCDRNRARYLRGERVEGLIRTARHRPAEIALLLAFVASVVAYFYAASLASAAAQSAAPALQHIYYGFSKLLAI